MVATYSYLEAYYRFQRPIFISAALIGLGSFNFLFFSLVFVSWYHGILAGAGTILGILVVSAFYYLIGYLSILCAGNIIGNMASYIIHQIRAFVVICKLIVFD